MSESLHQAGSYALRDVLRRMTRPADADLIETQPDGAVRCLACGHRCLVRPGKEGICRVRYNQAGTLKVPFGYVAGMACDPIEKKPFNHEKMLFSVFAINDSIFAFSNGYCCEL